MMYGPEPVIYCANTLDLPFRELRKQCPDIEWEEIHRERAITHWCFGKHLEFLRTRVHAENML